MTVKKLSQITQAGSPPALSDFAVGVSSSAVDLLYTFSQIKSAVGGGVTEDTAANILTSTPTAGLFAYATDLGVTFIADGSTWQIDSSYYTPQSDLSDLGWVAFSNRIGYGKDYVTDKIIANCQVGMGSFTGSISGQLRYNITAGFHGTLQVYNEFSSTWHDIVDNLVLFEIAGGVIVQVPIGFTSEIQIFNGDSVLLGLNGLPVIQGYKADMGAYPAQQQVNGGSF